jgi:hypothetical protein
MLHEFISDNREEIIKRSIGMGGTPASAADVIEHGLFVDQLSDALRMGLTRSRGPRVRFEHRRPLSGLTGSQVVWQDYFDVRAAITELALEMDALITVEEFSRLDRCIDDAIAQAVAGFGSRGRPRNPEV